MCRWSIKPTGATGIQLHFNAFDIGTEDYLRVTDVANGIQLANLTGSTIPADVTCYSGDMQVLFKSYDKDLSQGFSANYYTANSIEDLNLSSANITVSPNPVKDQLNLDLKNITEGNCALEIYSLDGRRVYSENLNLQNSETFKTVHVSFLSPGMYLLTLKNNQDRFFTKIIKE